ncbi:hypothetical protein ACFLTZ_05980 [Chloroflexota bacterium]
MEVIQKIHRSLAESVEPIVTKQDILRLIIRHSFEDRNVPVFRKATLPNEKEWALVVGTIGERGGGKSGSDAVLAMVDHMIFGKKCFSNMAIKCDVGVDDETARGYGLNTGGIVRYESLPLDKNALLKLDEAYKHSCILIEEINVQYSNIRRFMSNTNVDFNEVCQQMRKWEASLLYNVIDEMFVDPQLRTLTDIFIKTHDTAFDADNMRNKKARGLDFMWEVYPLSGYLRGQQNRYSVTHKSIGNICFHFGAWRGIYDSMRHQEKGLYTMSTKDKNKALLAGNMTAKITTESAGDMKDHMDRWSFLYSGISGLYQSGVKEMAQYDLFDMFRIEPSKEDEVDAMLVHDMRLRYRSSGSRKVYIFPERVFGRVCV